MKTKTTIPKTARELALDVLTRVDQEQAYSNLLLNRSLEKSELSRQEVGLATELVYGTIQRLNTIDYFLGRFLAKGVGKLQPWVRALLRLSFYQLYYLDRVPDHAVVSEAVTIAKRRGHQGISGMVNGVLRNVIRQRAELTIPTELTESARIALEHSHPEWLVKSWIARYGAETTAAMCAANNAPPKISVRVNQIRGSREQLLDKLRESGLHAEASTVSPSGIVLEQSGNMAHTDWFKQGLISIQDESSMLVAEVVDPKPGMMVLDCCAAPGGKTAHLAEKMGDQGTVWANDVHAHKEELVKGQASRLGLSIVHTRTGDAAELSSHFPVQSFDRILLDAPCSGLGVIRRKPDLKWVKQESLFREIADTQLKLLQSVAKLLKPDGILVYSTCTLEYTENEGVVQAFLEQNPEFAPDVQMASLLPDAVQQASETMPGTVQILPHVFGSDGFFISRLRRRS